MSKHADKDAQALEDFRRNVAAGLGMPVEMVFGDPKQVEPVPEAVLKGTKQRQERMKRKARRILAKLREAT